jgi:hypothetical protein
MCTMGAVDSSPKLRGQCWIGPCYNQLVFLLLFWRDQRLRRYLCDWTFSCVIVIRRTRVWDSGIGHTLGSTYLLCTFITTVTFYSTARVFLGFFLWWLTDEGVNNSVNRGVFSQNNDRSHFSRAGVPKRAGRDRMSGFSRARPSMVRNYDGTESKQGHQHPQYVYIRQQRLSSSQALVSDPACPARGAHQEPFNETPGSAQHDADIRKLSPGSAIIFVGVGL